MTADKKSRVFNGSFLMHRPAYGILLLTQYAGRAASRGESCGFTNEGLFEKSMAKVLDRINASHYTEHSSY
ncbi:MAG TPA: hypothetical protein DCZ91_11240 [Lachnospiraceae bacterium]|nr:hypothetical protein [Lachnospiraceae bacterium]